MGTDRTAAALGATGWSRRRFLGATASGLAAAALASCSLERASSPDRRGAVDDGSGFAGEYTSPPLEKPTVTFTDMFGKSFPFREKTDGKLTMLLFGYTSCPDVCPVYLNTIARAIEALGTGPGSDAQVLFVGVDVARDTPEQLQTYLGRIHPSFLGLTGSESVIAQANREMFQPPIVIHPPDENGEYAVDHGSKAFAFSADNVAHRYYPANLVRQQQWVQDLPRLADGIYR